MTLDVTGKSGDPMCPSPPTDSDGKQKPKRTNSAERLRHLVYQANNQSPSIFQKVWKPVTMGRHEPRLVESTFNEDKGTGGSAFPTCRLTTVSAEDSLSVFFLTRCCKQRPASDDLFTSKWQLFTPNCVF